MPETWPFAEQDLTDRKRPASGRGSGASHEIGLNGRAGGGRALQTDSAPRTHVFAERVLCGTERDALGRGDGVPAESTLARPYVPLNFSTTATSPAFRLATRISLIFGLMGGWISSAHAADSTKSLPRKKFKQHVVEVAFKTSEMGAAKRIAHPTYQNPGVILREGGEGVVFSQAIDPPLVLPASRFTWAGIAAGAGPSIGVTFNAVSDPILTLTVEDRNASNTKTVSVKTRARSIGTQTTAQYCGASFQNGLNCTDAFDDSILARNWSRSSPVLAALGVTSTGDNGKSNAAMHSYWNLLLARDVTGPEAEKITTSYEKLSPQLTGIDAGDPRNGSVLDLDNNARGRFIAGGMTFETSSGDDAAGQAAIISAVNGGQMTKMDQESNPGRSGLLEPSDK